MSFELTPIDSGTTAPPPAGEPSLPQDVIIELIGEDGKKIDPVASAASTIIGLVESSLNINFDSNQLAMLGDILDKVLNIGGVLDLAILDKIFLMMPETDLTKDVVRTRLGITTDNFDVFDPTRVNPDDVFPASSPQTINREAILERVRVHQGIHLTFNIMGAILSIIIEVLSVGQIDKIIENLQVIYSCAYSGSIYDRAMQINLEASLLRQYKYLVEEVNTSQIPPLSDLIVMLTREQLGEGQEGFNEFRKLMRYYGFNDFWAQAYWGSHWVLPNTQQLYDMFGRDLIDEETLKKQIIINDVKPEWVDRLVELSQRLPSRTEARMINRVRRMPKEKIDRILQAERIHIDYQDDYRLFIENQQLDNIYSRSITELSTHFERGYINEDEFRDGITNLNLSSLEVDSSVDLSNLRKSKKILDTDVMSLRLEFRKRAKGLVGDPALVVEEVNKLANKLSTIIKDRNLVDSIVDNEKARLGLPVDLTDDLDLQEE